MRRMLVSALLTGAMAFPAAAQHGGGARGGGFGGGHAGGGAGGFHGGFSGSAPVSHSFSGPVSRGGSFAPARGYRGAPGVAMRPGSALSSRFNGFGAGRAPFGAGRSMPRVSAARPTFYHRFGGSPVGARPGLYRNPYRGRFGSIAPGYGYGYLGLYPGFVSWNFLDWDLLDWDSTGWNPNTDSYSGAAYANPATTASYAAGPGSDPGYDPGVPAYAQAQPYAPQQPSAAPVTAPESAFSQPSPLGPVASGSPAPPRPEDPITIVFKDGRPPVQARNYALTRNAILLTSPRLHEIPLDQVDLPATERVNRAAGLDFALPQAH